MNRPARKRRPEKILVPATAAALGFAVQATAPVLAMNVPDTLAEVAGDSLRIGGGVLGWLALALTAARSFDAAVRRGAAAAGSDVPVPRLLGDLARLLLFPVAGVAILTFVFGQNPIGLIATSGVLVGVVGFASRNMIGDIFSGLALNFERPYRIGDWIEPVPGMIGRVVEISWRATRLVTLDQTTVILPNGLVANGRVTNYSAPHHWYRTHLAVTLDFAVSTERAKRLLMAGALAASEHLSPAHPPDVVVKEIGERGVVYDVRFWVRDYGQEVKSRDAVGVEVARSLRRAGIAAALPKRELSRPSTPSAYRLRPAAELIRQIELFEEFSDQEVETLAANAREKACPPGAAIVTQGEPGISLFLLVEGVLEVEANVEGQVLKLDRMLPGTVFGEASLLTGQPRSATVRALTDAVVLEVCKAHIDPLLAARPAIADTLAAIMVRRQRANQERRRLLAGAEPDAVPTGGEDLFQKVRSFFGLTR